MVVDLSQDRTVDTAPGVPRRAEASVPGLPRRILVTGGGEHGQAERKASRRPRSSAGPVDEIAPTALLLASADGGYYHGVTLNPNGGDVML